MEISRVELFCDDRKVGIVLRLLAGIALETPKVTPVINAKKKNNQLVEKIPRGDDIAMFAAYLKQHKLTEVNSTIGREYCHSIGKPPERYNYLFDKARRAGLLRKTGKGTHSKWVVK